MASVILREELRCSICLNLYTDPVILRCGHNFCRGCIDQNLNTQDGSGVYSCPECREEFQERPALIKNITLHNVAERLLSTDPHQEEISGICCTYCVDSPVPAVKSCLLCEASLCDKHLKVHSKSPEHILTDPSTSLENRKCSIHKKILEYYCTEDASCICVYCSAGEHRGHQVEKMDEASEKRKEKLRNVLQKLITEKEKTEERVQSLEERRRKAQEKPYGEAERVIALFIDIRRRIDDLEKRVLSEISRQEEMSLSLPDVIQKLEIKKDELSRKMRHIEELCNMTDPLTVLQNPDTGDLCDLEEGGGNEDTGRHDKTHDVDVDGITGMIHGGISDIVTCLQTISPAEPGNKRKRHQSDLSSPSHTQALSSGGDEVIISAGGDVMAEENEEIYGQVPADISLDVDTAANNIFLSDNWRTATWTQERRRRWEDDKRFRYYQVMSRKGFSSGRHYWDVEISEAKEWRVGVCYPSIERQNRPFYIGDNKQSWCLWGSQGGNNNRYSVIHRTNEIKLPHKISSDRVRICLDYDAGQLSFYELADPIRYLHTYSTIFKEDLHAAVWVKHGSVTISEG